MPPIVVVYGATGHTGRFVAAELAHRQIETRLVGRNREQLDALCHALGSGEVRVATVDDPAALDHALSGAAAVINCAGPFLDTSRPLIEAALRNRIHYLDVTAEQITTQNTFTHYDSAARAAGIVVMPAAAFYGGLADLLISALVTDWQDVETIALATALDFWHPTAGTRLTGARNTVPRQMIRDGRLAPLPATSPPFSWDFPAPFNRQEMATVPFSEMITVSRHINVRTMSSYLNTKPLKDLSSVKTPSPQSVDLRGRSAQRFVMTARVTRNGRTREATATGQDIYAVTAPLVVEACQRLMAMPAGTHAGTRAMGEVFDAAAFLSSLAPDIQTALSVG